MAFIVVDQALEVVDEYHDKINVLEREILMKPKVKNVRDRAYLLRSPSVSFSSDRSLVCLLHPLALRHNSPHPLR